jgi:hypothetical protein
MLIFRPYQNRICVENFYSFTSKTSRRNALSKPNAIQPLVLKRESIFPLPLAQVVRQLPRQCATCFREGVPKPKKTKRLKRKTCTSSPRYGRTVNQIPYQRPSSSVLTIDEPGAALTVDANKKNAEYRQLLFQIVRGAVRAVDVHRRRSSG